MSRTAHTSVEHGAVLLHCAYCGAQPGRWCVTRRVRPRPAKYLHGSRFWQQRAVAQPWIDEWTTTADQLNAMHRAVRELRVNVAGAPWPRITLDRSELLEALDRITSR